MILNFTKDENQDSQVNILEGNDFNTFSYTELIKALLNNEKVTCEFAEDYSSDEKEQVKALVDEINKIVV